MDLSSGKESFLMLSQNKVSLLSSFKVKKFKQEVQVELIKKLPKKEESNNLHLNSYKNPSKKKELSSSNSLRTSKSFMKQLGPIGHLFLTFASQTSRKNPLTNTFYKPISISDNGLKLASKTKIPQNFAGQSRLLEPIQSLSSKTPDNKKRKKKPGNHGKTQNQEEQKERRNQEENSSSSKKNKMVNNLLNKKSKSSMHQD